MSAGSRHPLGVVELFAAELRARWAASVELVIVGSVRRRRPEVGDIEFVAKAPEGENDPLFHAIAATMEPEQGSLLPGPERPLGRARRGLRPGFLAAGLELSMGGGTIPVEVHRSRPRNHGWVVVEYTGPAAFGRLFLSRWKGRWGIPSHQPASIGGHLVDRHGIVIPVGDEREAFEKCGMDWVEPEDRDRWAEGWRTA